MEDDDAKKTLDRDYFLLILVCPDAGTILLHAPDDRDDHAHLPFVRADRVSGSWRASAAELLKEIFVKAEDVATVVEKIQLIRISRFWYPATLKESVFLQRFQLFLSVSSEEKTVLQIQNNLSWIELKTVLAQGIVDPEMTEALRKLSAEMTGIPSFTFREYNQDAFLTDPNQKNVTEAKKLQMLLTKATNVQLDDQKRLYKEFLFYTFPKLFISYGQFEKLMVSLGWSNPGLKDLFRSFNTRRGNSGENVGNFLSYCEVLCGLEACEPHTPHGDETGEARCRYIFRFYSREHCSKLNFDEFCNMVSDIRRAKGYSSSPEDVEKEARASSKVFGCEENHNLTLNDFLTGVGQLKFRGTSNLLRSPESVFSLLRAQEEGECKHLNRRKRCRPQPQDPSLLSFESVYEDDEGGLASMSALSNNSPLAAAVDPDYDFATHVIKVKRSGQVVDVKSLWEMEGEIPEAISVSSSFTNAGRSNFGRLQSIRAFNVSSEANEMLVGLRYFERPSKSSSPEKLPLTWGKVDMGTFGRSLIDLCHQARGLLIQEPRLVKLRSPTYILGDLHGNFRDLVCFEKILWRMGPKLVPANFLFLGDYVDRGEHGVEVVAYLFAQKVAAPTKFHLLRGNHEDRRIQQIFTFHKECLDKFGPDLGAQVWEEVNLVFDVMPIGAVIDGKIFCVHGGIPPPWLGDGLVSALDKVDKDINEPEKEQLVWEYMWNDPLPTDRSNFPEEAQAQLVSPELKGFVDNWRRSTGHMFSDKALDEFLCRNKLSHVIRAHEVKKAGFQVQHHQKLLTVFSSSKYCNGVNEAACALADRHKLRLIRLDTS